MPACPYLIPWCVSRRCEGLLAPRPAVHCHTQHCQRWWWEAEENKLCQQIHVKQTYIKFLYLLDLIALFISSFNFNLARKWTARREGKMGNSSQRLACYFYNNSENESTILKALANASMATASFPGVLAASLETASAINISALPDNTNTKLLLINSRKSILNKKYNVRNLYSFIP